MRRDDATFNLSFLDLLSCGLGAVVLLCLVFAASKPGNGTVEGGTAVLLLTPDANANCSISAFVDRGQKQRVFAGMNLEGISISRPATNGASGTLIISMQAGALKSEDSVVIYAYELGPSGKLPVAVKVLGAGTASGLAKTFTLLGNGTDVAVISANEIRYAKQ